MTVIYDCRWSDKADDRFIRDYIMLQRTVFKNNYNIQLFEKKYLQNIYGQSIIVVAYNNGKPIGARAFWRNDIQGIEAYQPGDVCVLEEYRGNGVFTEMTKIALDRISTDALIYTFPNPNSFPAHLKMGHKLVASYYPRFFTHNKYQKESNIKMDKAYITWWLSSNKKIRYIEKKGSYYLVMGYGLPCMYIVIAEVDDNVAKLFRKCSIGVYFYRSKKVSFYNKNKCPLRVMTFNDTTIWIPPWKADYFAY